MTLTPEDLVRIRTIKMTLHKRALTLQRMKADPNMGPMLESMDSVFGGNPVERSDGDTAFLVLIIERALGREL